MIVEMTSVYIPLQPKIVVPKAGSCKHSQKHQIATRNQAQQSKLNKNKIDKRDLHYAKKHSSK